MGCSGSRPNNVRKGRPKGLFTLEKKPIGKGIFIKCYKGESKLSDKTEVAVKTFDKKFMSPEDMEAIKYKVDVLCELDHPNIVKYFEWYETKTHIHCVSKFVYGQTLQEVIEFRRREFTELEVAEIMKQLFSAISYLHGNKITHMNIIPNNVMVDQDLNVTLIDFGLGRLTKKGMVINTKKDISQFTAPESYEGYYTDKSDIWSLGNLLYFIFAGKLPFSTDGAMDVFKKSAQRNLTFKSACWYDVSKEAKKLICHMMSGDPEKRPDHLDLVSHTWFDAAERQQMMKEIDKVDKEALEKLKNFRFRNDLQKIFTYMHVNMLLDDNDFPEYQAKFTQIDKNNDGYISRDELGHAFELASMPLDNDQLDAIIINLDFTGKRQMNFTEFLCAVLDREKLKEVEPIRDLFKFFDSDGDKKINGEDMFREIQAVDHNYTKKYLYALCDKYANTVPHYLTYPEMEKMIMDVK